MNKSVLLACALTWLLVSAPLANANGGNGYDLLPQYVAFEVKDGAFRIAGEGVAAPVYVDTADWAGVLRAAGDLCADIERVTGIQPQSISNGEAPQGAIVVGTLGRCGIIDQYVAEGKLDASEVAGKWESFVIANVDGNLVVAGSDKRGTIYGIYDISEKIGVSPWYYWADVPVSKHDALYFDNGVYVMPEPKVKYRGIFINDEWPSFGGWATAKFGGVNSKMYATMFELLLRLKANYLWPAMWDSAFNEDDPLTPKVADEYGIVMGTSHHEPMMRAHKEYTRRREEVGPWNYATNRERIDDFFRYGIERNKDYDNLITIGMRGDGDVAMGSGDDKENMAVLYDVIAGQRQIIADVYGCDPAEVPQLWAIFTEVQRYYDAGFTVPEDVTLLFCDNNWGYIRRYGPVKERGRKGGLGMYYHIDMNGGPASDRWVNTTTVPKIREQLNLAYQTGIDRIWIINVGDLKPKEMPIDFIMRYAWDPEAIGPEDCDGYMHEWARRIFGPEHADEIAGIVHDYSNYNLMRKAEVQNPGIFSIVNYCEADSMLMLWRDVAERAKALAPKIAPEMQDAYYQLVYYPAVASAGVAEIYLAAGKNNLYAAQGRASANAYADRCVELFDEDARLSAYYNGEMAGGKWQNMMSDNHIGYTTWQIPQSNALPHLERVAPLTTPAMGVAVEGMEEAWPTGNVELALPPFEPLGTDEQWIDIFNRGRGEFAYSITSDSPWIVVGQPAGKVDEEDLHIPVKIDWELLDKGKHSGELTVADGSSAAKIAVVANKYDMPTTTLPYHGAIGEYKIPAYAYANNICGEQANWTFAPSLGRGKGCMLIDRVTAPSAKNFTEAPALEYAIYVPEAKEDMIIALGILPTQDIDPARGLRIAVSVDGGPIKVLDARRGLHDEFGEYTPQNIAMSPHIKPLPNLDRPLALRGWGKPRRTDVFDNQRWIDTSLGQMEAGLHTLTIHMVDPEIVLESIVVNPDNAHPSYWGAPSHQN